MEHDPFIDGKHDDLPIKICGFPWQREIPGG
jgi:hypothetical protein